MNQLAEGGVLKKGQGFNRYMVECESYGLDYSRKCEACFNRYMVECESILTAQQLSEILVLIDTWWNVNNPYGFLKLKNSPF